MITIEQKRLRRPFGAVAALQGLRIFEGRFSLQVAGAMAGTARKKAASMKEAAFKGDRRIKSTYARRRRLSRATTPKASKPIVAGSGTNTGMSAEVAECPLPSSMVKVRIQSYVGSLSPT